MKYTIEELIQKLSQFPSKMLVQLDIEGQLYDEIEVDAGQSRVIIFSKDEPSF